MIYNPRVSVHPAAALLLLLSPLRAQAPFDARAALSAPSPERRSGAAFALGQLGFVEIPDGAVEPESSVAARRAAAAALAGAAADASPAVRRAVVEALGKVSGPGDEKLLLAAADDGDAGVRGEAALALFRRRLLGRAPDYSSATVGALVRLAGDAEPEVRWRAAYALSKWPEPRALSALESLQADSDVRARLFAVRALGRIGAAPDPARLADRAVYVRAEAVAAFSAAKAWSSLPDSVFTDASAHVRAAAADAAGASGDAKRFAPLLEKLAAGPGTSAPGRALLALARLRAPGAEEVLAKALKDPRWWLRARAYEASALLPDAEEILKAGVSDPDPRVSSQALETLAASTTPATTTILDRVLRDPKAELELRGTAIEAAAERKDPALVDALIAAMAFATGPGSGETRGDIRDALNAAAKEHPETAARIAAALKPFPAFADKPRVFAPLKSAPSVRVTTERGAFVIRLAGAEDAGNHVAAFARSVSGHFYDGLTWHRVVTAFVVQGGDPRGSGWGDAGWRLADEINRLPFDRGTVGMPKAGKDTGGCQLFISLVPTPHLDGRYTAFGKVVSGMDVVDRLEPGDKILSMRLQ
jgi:cyclophilin family peptidyl-prolyl cis-trans isomerase/HEAT repeat protein